MLLGAIFVQVSPFRAKSHFLQILDWTAIFAQICDLAERNFSQVLQCARRYLCFPAKDRIFCAGLARKSINFCANWALYSYQRKIHLTHNTTVCFMQILLIIQKTRLYYGYRTVFLKQNRKKTFRRNHKTFTQNFWAIFRGFSADFSAQFAHIAHSFSAFSVQFSHKFCTFPPQFSSGTDIHDTMTVAGFEVHPV